MAGFATRSNTWGYTITNEPLRVASAPGTSLVPGSSDVYGAYSQAIDGAVDWAGCQGDGCLLEIGIFDSSIAAQNGDTKLRLGLDLAGGSTYTTFIDDLVAGPAGTTSSGLGGVWFTFPIRIPKGASVGVCAAQTNAGAKGTMNVVLRISGDPSQPEQVRVGKYVRSFGVSGSAGTGVTAGASGAAGAWVQLGSAVGADDDLWWWQLGVGCSAAVSNNNGASADLGLGSASFKQNITTVFVGTNANEAVSKPPHARSFTSTPGDLLYGRMSCAGSALAGFSLAAYAVGG